MFFLSFFFYPYSLSYFFYFYLFPGILEFWCLVTVIFKFSVLYNNIYKKKSLWCNSVLIKCGPPVDTQFYENQSSRWIWLKKRWKFWCIHRKTSWMEISFKKKCKSRVHPCNFIKFGLHHRGFLAWVLPGTSFQNFGKFSARFHCYSSYTWGCSFTEDDLFRIYIQN